MIKEIIFDFDGTLALTFEESIRIINSLGFGQLKEKEIKIFRNEGWKKALKEIKFPFWKLAKMGRQVQMILNGSIDKLETPEGLKESLLALERENLVLGILTSNTEENVKKFLKSKGLDMFRYIYSEKSIFGKDKKMKKILKERGLKKDEVIYVGDEVRDFEVCQKVGIKMIGVNWGFNSKEFLEKAGVEKIIDYAKDLNLSLILSQ